MPFGFVNKNSIPLRMELIVYLLIETDIDLTIEILTTIAGRETESTKIDNQRPL